MQIKKFFMGIVLAAVAMTSAACTRIETGEVGVRIGMDKQVASSELQPGSFNQTVFGSVMTFPVKDNQVNIAGLTPLAADNSTISSFDLSVVYSINPTSVAELYTKKSRGFHATDDTGDTYLMYNYIQQLARNAVYKVARDYPSLKLNDARADIEAKIRAEIVNQLEKEKLVTDILVSQVLVRQIVPSERITNSANLLVQAQNERLRKEVEVETAELEAKRIAALNANAGATKYMHATAAVTIAEAVRAGKVKTIVIPHNFDGIVNVQ